MRIDNIGISTAALILNTFSRLCISCHFSPLLTIPLFFSNFYFQHLIVFVEKNWTRVSRVHTKTPAAIVEISALAPSQPQPDAWQLVDNTIMHAYSHWNYCEEKIEWNTTTQHVHGTNTRSLIHARTHNRIYPVLQPTINMWIITMFKVVMQF